MRGSGEVKGAANERLKNFFRPLDDHHLLRLATAGVTGDLALTAGTAANGYRVNLS